MSRHGNLTLPEFNEMIRTDKNNFFSSPDELLQAFKGIIERQIEGKLGDILYNKPNATLEILEVPASQPDADQGADPVVLLLRSDGTRYLAPSSRL